MNQTRQTSASATCTNGEETLDSGELASEQRIWIKRILNESGLTHADEIVSDLAARVEVSMQHFRDRLRSHVTFCQNHEALRKLVLLADQHSPALDRLRTQICQLPAIAMTAVVSRAKLLWDREFQADYPPEGFAAWSRLASKGHIIRAVQAFCSDGGDYVFDRRRSGVDGRKRRFEPRILGVVRGQKPPKRQTGIGTGTESTPRLYANGRPPAHDIGCLILNLAGDWHAATGHSPQSGRSDSNGFGALVHHIFGWLDFETAEPALRRFWAIATDDLRIRLERGDEVS